MTVVKKPQRFEDFIMKECGCWIWKGAYNSKFKPIYISRGKAKDARKVCFEKHVCPIGDKSLEVKCKDQRCIRPDHQKVIP